MGVFGIIRGGTCGWLSATLRVRFSHPISSSVQSFQVATDTPEVEVEAISLSRPPFDSVGNYATDVPTGIYDIFVHTPAGSELLGATLIQRSLSPSIER